MSGWLVAALFLSACAETGSEQVVTVVSDPPGASCQLSRENLSLGTVPQTPGSLKISKSVAPLIVACSAAGYETITGGFEALFVGNPQTTLINGAREGKPPGLDATYYAYPDTMTITLRRPVVPGR
ncbi:MAG: hypothetical protein JO055_15630 [Alphaproteobacteria bacterium]|nr:hypothetical protein [Alphaproteobacteria bacterium]